MRVVRRHVAKLEAAGWLARAPWIWGERSVAWLTAAGIESAGLGGVRPVKTPPGPTTIAHGVLVGWSAARVERRGRTWKSARELAVERERWAIRARCDRGYTELLPDLAVGLKRSEPPVAVIAESGGRREDRQKLILDGWRDAILSGRYAAVHYHCASASVAHWIGRLAKKVRLTGPTFLAPVQMSADEIAALPPATATADVDELLASGPQSTAGAPQPVGEQAQIALVRAPLTPALTQPERAVLPSPELDTPDAAAERSGAIGRSSGSQSPNPAGGGHANARPLLADEGSARAASSPFGCGWMALAR